MYTLYEHIPSLIVTYVVTQKHTRHVVYRAAKRFQKPSSAILFIHILIPNLEILRYWAHYLQYGYHVSPTYLDFAVMVFHSWTSHYLVTEGHYAGHKHIVQPVFHAQTLLRLAISFCSVFLGFPSWHSATIKINAATSYPRILVWAAKKLNVLPTYKDVYTAVMFIGSLLTVHDSGVWYAPHIFIGCWAGLCLLERWVAQEMFVKNRGQCFSEPSSWYGGLKDGVVNVLNATGFVNRCELRMLQKRFEEEELSSDGDVHNRSVGAKTK
ncbi:hypothetical protein BKA67DRAFT_541887 [Truncatella angustata]|uniref:Uncharacterized protein n=1 Tax=Truncatella angustata TaxID=152316 RepID=A0A9P8RM31_9PEZI|nr:uncharacterized protein BKA67DRAFT_541887 [Truncatella angustata]KAH6645730.1 hypothetical protein BKA67DRAFT_541887 [Truncatella angustata]